MTDMREGEFAAVMIHHVPYKEASRSAIRKFRVSEIKPYAQLLFRSAVEAAVRRHRHG